MPVRKYKLGKPLLSYQKGSHIMAEGPLSERDITLLQEFRTEPVLTLTRVSSLDFIAGWTDLRSLRMYACKVEDWSPLTTLKKLEDLFINGIRERTPDLSFLSQMRTLKDLGVGHVPHWTTFPDMSRCTRLKRLNIFGCKRLTDLSAVVRIKKLESFDIVLTPQKPADLEAIMAMPTMKCMAAAFGRAKEDALFAALLTKYGLFYG